MWRTLLLIYSGIQPPFTSPTTWPHMPVFISLWTKWPNHYTLWNWTGRKTRHPSFHSAVVPLKSIGVSQHSIQKVERQLCGGPKWHTSLHIVSCETVKEAQETMIHGEIFLRRLNKCDSDNGFKACAALVNWWIVWDIEKFKLKTLIRRVHFAVC